MKIGQRHNRIYESNLNKQGCLMKIIGYNNANDIMVEFQDIYMAKVHTDYKSFKRGEVKNPYCTTVFGVGIIGDKYFVSTNRIKTKEYKTWCNMLKRCFDEKTKEKYPSYKNVTCCEEWLSYEKFYEWLHSQDNFDKWYNGEMWCLDKDILVKRNKVYSPETCCLVPTNVNNLFVKRDLDRGILPIGVNKKDDSSSYYASCKNPFTNKREYLGGYKTIDNAFKAYKNRKENLIKQVAEIEYNNGNITKQCYDGMMNYKVEITD